MSYPYMFLFLAYFGVFLYLCAVSDGHLILNDGFVGIGLDLSKLSLGKRNGACPASENFTCVCGAKETPIAVAVPICSSSYRWKVSCKPCDDLTPEVVCPRYRLCEQCQLDGGNSCVTCPPGKFGKWCENTCNCRNGGVCERSGKCQCPHDYEGITCELWKGCAPLAAIRPPLEVILQPPDLPVTAVYSCPTNYVLSGPAVSTCISGSWTSSPPTCRPKCPILSAPANGRLIFSGSDLVEGISGEVECLQGYRLVGERTLTCMAGGKWNHNLPVCEELATCPDPGNANHAERTILPNAIKIGGHFLQDSRIQFKCKAGFEQMGF